MYFVVINCSALQHPVLFRSSLSSRFCRVRVGTFGKHLHGTQMFFQSKPILKDFFTSHFSPKLLVMNLPILSFPPKHYPQLLSQGGPRPRYMASHRISANWICSLMFCPMRRKISFSLVSSSHLHMELKHYSSSLLDAVLARKKQHTSGVVNLLK